MSHVEVPAVNIDHVINAGPIRISSNTQMRLWAMVAIGSIIFLWGVTSGPAAHVWAAFYVNFLFFLGLSMGATMTTVIMQIVRAKWSPPIRRLGEANISFLPVAFIAFLMTYVGKEYLFYWGRAPMPGREWWMQPNFVYFRFTVLFGALFFMMTRFVRMSLRADVGLARERAKDKGAWYLPAHNSLLHKWVGAEREIIPLQRRMSIEAPIVVAMYAIIYSLFAFEMIMGMDPSWISNLFGAFIFISSIYIGWASLALSAMFFARKNKQYGELLATQQLWDLGKLTLGFCMLWGYMFWSQFLTQWYGNLPEETAWLFLRTREWPWMGIAWLAFPMSFVIPFIMLLSRDLKKTPWTYAGVCFTLMAGVWLDRYLIVMPQVSPDSIPFGIYEVAIFIGFLGAYLLCIRNFLAKYPFVPISHPLTHGSIDW